MLIGYDKTTKLVISMSDDLVTPTEQLILELSEGYAINNIDFFVHEGTVDDLYSLPVVSMGVNVIEGVAQLNVEYAVIEQQLSDTQRIAQLEQMVNLILIGEI